MKDENRQAWPLKAALVMAIFSSFMLLPLSVHAANARQEEIFNGIKQGVGGEVDGSKLLAGFAMIVGLIILIALMNVARNRKVTPRVLNHPGKLMKEVARGANLKPAEVKQLKVLSEDQDLTSPLVLLLCPSVLGKAIKLKGDKIDKRVVAAMVKRLTAQPAQPVPALARKK